MRIRKIRIKNIASLAGEQIIDFTTEPLRSANLFAITGDTGAGKSSILDAICLALYDDVPRLNAAADKESMDKYFPPDSPHGDNATLLLEPIPVNDVRSLLRRGEVEAYAYVEFEAKGKIYEAGWTVARGHKKVSGKLQKAKRSIVQITTAIDGQRIEIPEGDQGKKTTVAHTVSELIGLTFDEFARSVLLAQGDFAGFLKAKPKEKTDILEKITGTEIYGRISKTIYERKKALEDMRQEIKRKMEALHIPSFEEQEQKRNERLSIEALMLQTQEAIISLKHCQVYRTTLDKLNRELSEADRSLAELREHAYVLATDRLLIKRLDAAESIRQHYFAKLNSANSLASKENQHEKEKKSLPVINKEILQTTQEVAECISKQNLLENTFAPLLSDLPKAERLDNLCSRAADSCTEIKHRRDQHTQANHQSCQQIKLHQTALSDLAIRAAKGKEAYDSYLPYRSIATLLPLIDSDIKSMDEQRQRILQIVRLIAALDAKAQDIQQRTAFLTHRMQELNAQSPAEVMILRQRLSIGIPCPVCGQAVQEIPNTTTADSYLADIERERSSTQAAIDALQIEDANISKERIKLEAEQQTKKESQQRLLDKLEQLLISFIPSAADLILHGTVLVEAQRLYSLFENADKDLKTIQEQQKQITDALTQELNAHGKIEAELAILTQRYRILEERSAALHTARKQVLCGRKVKEVRNAYDSQKRFANDALLHAKERLIQIESRKREAAILVNTLAEDIRSLNQEKELYEAKIQQWLESNDLDEEQLKFLFEVFLPKSQTIRAQINQVDSLIHAADATVTERIRARSEHLQTIPINEDPDVTDETLAQKILDLDIQLCNSRSRQTELEAFFQCLQHNSQQKKLLSQEEEELLPLLHLRERVAQDFGSADGEAFRAIAQAETLRRLTYYANHHLLSLAPRYRLAVIPGSLSLQVVDGYDSDRIRSVNSLSGGETFLCSLALALGLSSAISQSVRCDNLFIDEGFGTLDATSLDMAISALERLEEGGRSIGIISHVPELSERIATAIHVERSPGTGIGRIQIRSTALP